MHKAVTSEINQKILKNVGLLKILKQHQKILDDTGRLVVTKGTEFLYKEGMTEKQLRAFISNDRELKNRKYKMRQVIKGVEQELEQLEYKSASYKREFEKQKTKIKIEEVDHIDKCQYRFEGSLKNPKMRKSLNRKRALLHDTLHSRLKANHKVTAFETKEGEQYTIDLLRKTEEKDLEDQRKFLQRIEEKEELRRREERRKRLAIQKRIREAKARVSSNKCRKERCLSALMIKEQSKNSKNEPLPLDMAVGLHTVSHHAGMWNKALAGPKFVFGNK